MPLLNLQQQVTFGKGKSNCKWLFQCDCGRKVSIVLCQVTGGHVTNCRGCGHKKAGITRTLIKQTYPNFGLPKHSLYSRWASMLRRCDTKNSTEYHNYGGRGISVCKDWHTFHKYKEYVETILGPVPTPQHTLDRINNEGNYEPGNLRWATKTEQNLNSRQAIMYGKILS